MLQVEHIQIGKHLQILDSANVEPLQMDRPQLDHSLNSLSFDGLPFLLGEIAGGWLIQWCLADELHIDFVLFGESFVVIFFWLRNLLVFLHSNLLIKCKL